MKGNLHGGVFLYIIMCYGYLLLRQGLLHPKIICK